MQFGPAQCHELSAQSLGILAAAVASVPLLVPWLVNFNAVKDLSVPSRLARALFCAYTIAVLVSSPCGLFVIYDIISDLLAVRLNTHGDFVSVVFTGTVFGSTFFGLAFVALCIIVGIPLCLFLIYQFLFGSDWPGTEATPEEKDKKEQ